MLKVLFVESPYSYGHARQLVGSYFPLGIGYIAAYVREFGYDVNIFQNSKAGNFQANLINRIEQLDPDVLAISVMTPSYPSAIQICEIAKSKSDRLFTVLGGHHVSALGSEVFAQTNSVDFVVFGEGEITFLELLKELEGNRNFSEIDGLIYRDLSNGVHQNSPRLPIADLDILPFPARDLVDMSRFRLHSYIDFGKRSATMITSRGCPYRCMYCSSFITMGRKYRYRSVSNILKEIEALTFEFNIDHIVFEDDTLTLKRDRIEKLCHSLASMNKPISWYCLSRVETVDYELARLMKDAGCKMINFGIESGSSKVLKTIPKHFSIETAQDAVASCKKAGLRTQCTFIVGFPADTESTMEKTFEAAKRIAPTLAIFFPLTPYPGTRAYDNFLEAQFKPKNVSSWHRFIMTDNDSGLSVNKNYSGEKIKEIADEWNRRFYLRPIQWLRIALTVKEPRQLFRLMKGAVYLAKNSLSNYLCKFRTNF